jgi:hypothetical protein
VEKRKIQIKITKTKLTSFTKKKRKCGCGTPDSCRLNFRVPRSTDNSMTYTKVSALKIFRKLLNPVQCRHVCVAQRYGVQSLTLIQLFENLSDNCGVRKHVLDPKCPGDNSLNKLFCAYDIFDSGRSDNFLHLHRLTVLNAKSQKGALIRPRSRFVNYFVSMH